MAGCDWVGLFRESLEHLGVCQFVTTVCKNTGCGERVLLSELEVHLKGCLERHAECKDCGKKMSFIELKEHTELCPNVSKVCKNCKKKITTSEVGFWEMTAAYHQPSIRRIGDLEMKNEALKKKPSVLQGEVGAYETEKQLTEQSQEMISSTGLPRHGDQVETSVNIGQQMKQIQQKIQMLEKNWTAIREEMASIKASNDQGHSPEMEEIEILSPEPEQHQLVPYRQTSHSVILPYERPPSTKQVKQVEDKMLEVERTLNVLTMHQLELEQRLQASLGCSFMWRIAEVCQKIRDAKTGHITSINSPPFYTGRNGYKMCIRAYLNGDGTGEGSHLSIFFVLMRGEYDPLLQWPFESKVSLILVDQDHKKHLVQTFKPDPQSSSFKRPDSDMNIASGCPEFAELSILDNPSYVKEDVMYINAKVNISKLFLP